MNIFKHALISFSVDSSEDPLDISDGFFFVHSLHSLSFDLFLGNSLFFFLIYTSKVMHNT